MEMLEEHHPNVVLALKSRKFTSLDLRNVLLLDNQSTFVLCCNKTFASKDHRKMQDTGLQVFGLVQQESHHKYHLPQESYQVLSSDI